MPRTIMLCNCDATQTVDPARIGAATGCQVSRTHRALCTTEAASAQAAIAGGDVVIACGQEAARFAAMAEALGVAAPQCIDIRDRAGWTEAGQDPGPKQAALLADGLLGWPEPRVMDVESRGTVLILGQPADTLAAAEALAPTMAVTVLTTTPPDLAELPHGFQIVSGRLASATGSLGRYRIEIDRFQMPDPAGRGAPRFTAPRDGAQSACDIILDLTGGPSLFPAPHKRDGYLRADPARPGAVGDAVAEVSQMLGVFEKPLFLRLDTDLCAHSRAGQIGCTRCLDICPTGAITPDGEHVAIDPHICAGCGGCAASCPSGAISFDLPPFDALLRRVEALARHYREAGGDTPRLLIHEEYGAEMIRLTARFGRGLPEDVIPLQIDSLNSFGHAEALAALATGFGAVLVLPGPRTETAPLQAQIVIARAMGAGDRLALIEPADPDALSDLLYGADTAPAIRPTLPMGSRRQVARLSARALGVVEPVELPQGAPYGAVLVDQQACTLCLSCVSLCPSGALIDNPDRPELRFQEDACLQCGLCANICPENAITLQPRFDPRDAALSPRLLHEEPPFPCIECGKEFGVASTVQRIVEKLEGHPMFQGSAQARVIQMCEDCRIQAQFGLDDPMATGGRRPRMTSDYLSKENPDG